MRIGIAGYMGAGKTTCARTFESDDALIIDADTEAKMLMTRDRTLQRCLQDVFGTSVVDDGYIRTEMLGHIAFESVESLLTLNRIVHPPLVNYLEGIIIECSKPLCILDAALIPLLNIESWFDLCVWVDAPFEVRFERLKAKRGDIDEQELIRRMRLQENVMDVPNGSSWTVLPYSDCREYINTRLYSIFSH